MWLHTSLWLLRYKGHTVSDWVLSWRIRASIAAASRLLLAVMAWMSPVRWRLNSSIGITWEYPPPAAPPKQQSNEAILTTSSTFYSKCRSLWWLPDACKHILSHVCSHCLTQTNSSGTLSFPQWSGINASDQNVVAIDGSLEPFKYREWHFCFMATVQFSLQSGINSNIYNAILSHARWFDWFARSAADNVRPTVRSAIAISELVYLYTELHTSSGNIPISLARSEISFGCCERAMAISLGTGLIAASGKWRNFHSSAYQGALGGDNREPMVI